MKHVIDNFDAIREHLRFDKPGDMYVAHVMFRVKDLRTEADKQMYLSHEETQRLVKTYYINSLEYFDRKRPAMIDLAIQNKARVYIAMTRKSRLTCNRIILKKLVDMVDDPNVRYDHLIRTSVCGCHISDYKWWLLDVDQDTVLDLSGQRLTDKGFVNIRSEVKLIDLVDELIPQMRKLVDETKTRSGDEIFTVPTKNGFHVMTPPFRKDYLFSASTGTCLFRLGDNLKTDAMTLVYFQWEDGKIQQDKEIEEQQ